MILALLLFFLYILILVGIGIFTSKKQTEEGFMLSDRKVGGVFLPTTLAAGFFDGAILATYIAYIYQFGFSAIWLFLGLIVGFLFLQLFVHKIKAKADEMHVYTMPEYFFRLFGKSSGLLFSIIIIIQFIGLLIVNLIISGKVLTAIFPISYTLAVIIGGVIVLSYLTLSGFKAVIRTDFFQVILMFLMVITVGGYLIFRNPEALSTINIGNINPADLIAFIVLGVFVIFTAPDLWQRIFAARDVSSLKKGLKSASIILIFLAFVISIVGIVTRQYFPGIKPEDALVVGFSNLLPFFLKELGLVLLYAVSLSSTDTVTFVISSILTRDLKNYSPTFMKTSMRIMARIFVGILLTLAVITAILYQNIISIMLSLASLSVGLFPIVFGSLFWKLNKMAVLFSLLLAFVSVILLLGFGYINPQTSLISLPVSLITLILLSAIFRYKLIKTS